MTARNGKAGEVRPPELPQELTVLVEAPLGEPTRGYIRDRVEITSLTTEQAAALNRLTVGLRSRNARCQRRDARTENGIVVDKEVDAIRWLLDQLAERAAVGASG